MTSSSSDDVIVFRNSVSIFRKDRTSRLDFYPFPFLAVKKIAVIEKGKSITFSIWIPSTSYQYLLKNDKYFRE